MNPPPKRPAGAETANPNQLAAQLRQLQLQLQLLPAQIGAEREMREGECEELTAEMKSDG
jgi:prefoldin subunit 5